MELLELLDPKGSDDAAETAKGSVPPEELNGSEALDANGSVDEFVAPLEAADENPPKGSEEKAGTANGSDVENGSADVEPKSFPHYKRIAKEFDKAKKRAWASIKKDNDVQKLLIEERNQKLKNREANKGTIDKILEMPK